MPDEPKTHGNTEEDAVLDEDQLEQVSGGIGLLLPAVQKVREAAARSSDDLPMEQISLNYEKIK